MVQGVISVALSQQHVLYLPMVARDAISICALVTLALSSFVGEATFGMRPQWLEDDVEALMSSVYRLNIG